MVDMLVGVGGVGIWTGLTTVFNQNQTIWKFDKNMRQGAVHTAQNNALSKVGLWREDLRDLFALTNKKMDAYTTVSTIMLGFCIGLTIDYSLEKNCPTWIFILAITHNAAGFAYGVLSMIFSMYASIVTQQFLTKTMTECVRLPIPDSQAIEKASANARTFENLSNFRTMMRVPVLGRMLPGQKAEGGAPLISETPHFEVFRRLQGHWMPLANFSRVCMISALTSINYALIYYFLSEHVRVSRQMWGTCLVVIILTCSNMMLQKLDYMVSNCEWFFMLFCHLMPPIAALVGHMLSMLFNSNASLVCAPMAYFGHAAWCLFVLHAARPSTETSRTKFRLTVLQELQFGRPGQISDDLVELEEDFLTEAASTVASEDDFIWPQGAETEGMQVLLRQEVQHYHRTAAVHLSNLKQTRGVFRHYEEEFSDLSQWCGEPENPFQEIVGVKPEDVTKPELDAKGRLNMRCPAGHTLHEKEGRTVFHIKNRFCAQCLRDFARRDLRYLCRECYKYEVCGECLQKPELGAVMIRKGYIGTVSRAEQEKEEKLLRYSLKDLRRRIPGLEDCRGRRPAPRRRGSLRAQHRKRDSDDAPLEEELAAVLPDPIKEEKIEEMLENDALRGLHALPWSILRSVVSFLWLMWTIAFFWSLVQAASPQDLTRPHPDVLTHEWARDYGYFGRRLSPDNGSSTEHVARWLRFYGHEEAAAYVIVRDIDGLTLRYLDQEGWDEIGISSAIERARLWRLLFLPGHAIHGPVP